MADNRRGLLEGVQDRLRGLFFGSKASGTTEDGLENPLLENQTFKFYKNYIDTKGEDRRRRYDDYEQMDTVPELSSALDIYADDATQMDRAEGATVWVEAQNKNYIKAIEDMLKQIDIEDIIWALTRDTGKYGDLFLRIFYFPESTEANAPKGVRNIKFVDPRYVERCENDKGQLIGFKVDSASGMDFKGDDGKPCNAKPWDFIHFRVLGRRVDKMYGDSMLEPARSVWRQLSLLEDSLMLFRLQQAPDRQVFYIDVGNASPEDQLRIVKRWERRFKEKYRLDPSGGDLKVERNPMSMRDMIFWPIRPESKSRVERLQGSADVGNIVDVEYFRNKMFAAIKIPRAFLGGEESGMWNSKAYLSEQSLQMARTVSRLQRSVIMGLTRLAQCHLSYLDLDPNPDFFTVQMSSVSTVDEIQKAEILMSQINACLSLGQLITTLRDAGGKDFVKWVLTAYMHYSDEDANMIANSKPVGAAAGGAGLFAGEETDVNAKVGRFKELLNDPEIKEQVKEMADKLRKDPSIGRQLRERLASRHNEGALPTSKERKPK